MTVRVVTSPYHRLRCVSCLQRVGDTEGPFFDFGEFPDALAEKIGEDHISPKLQHHGDVLVCAPCIRKAYEKLPHEADRLARTEARLADALEERNEWRELAMAGDDLKAKLDEVLTRATPQVPMGPSASEPTPPQTTTPDPDAETAADVNPTETVSVETPKPENDDEPTDEERAEEARRQAILSGPVQEQDLGDIPDVPWGARQGRPAEGEPDPDDPSRSPLWDKTIKEIKADLREQGIAIPAELQRKEELIAWAESLDDDPDGGAGSNDDGDDS